MAACLLAAAHAGCQDRPEFVEPAPQDPPLYDYAPWPDEPTPTPWPGGIVPVTRHVAPPNGVEELFVDTEPPYEQFQYTLRDVRLTVGDTVTFRFKARREYHTFTLENLGIDDVITPGQANRFTYTFNVPGTFEFYCIPHPYMTGTITITEGE